MIERSSITDLIPRYIRERTPGGGGNSRIDVRWVLEEPVVLATILE
jgi:hypothetical protein